MEYQNDGSWNYNSGNWTHIAFTSKRHTSPDSVNGSLKIFVDGILERQYNGWQNNNNRDLREKIFIGSYNGNSDYFHGEIDDIRIYSGALSVDEVKDLYDRESEDIKSVDFVNKIVIPSGSKSQRFYVFAEDDEVFAEGTENLLLAIDSAVSANVSSGNSISIDILENDIRPTMKLERKSGSLTKEGDNSKYVVLEASIDSVTTVPLTIKLKTSGDAEGSDYYVTNNPDDTISHSSINTQGSFAPGRWSLRPDMSRTVLLLA